LGREVIPRLSNAANYYSNGADVYRFLAKLQDQSVQGGAWTWGALEKEPQLPRVVHGRWIFSLATWNLGKAELEGLRKAGTPRERFKVVQELKLKRTLPRHILLRDGDNELPVDLENPLSVEAFYNIIRKRDQITLSEDFPGAENLVASGPDGRFTHELVLPFMPRKRPPVMDSAEAAATGWEAPSLETDRILYAPGSEWLYFKLYTGLSSADKILQEVIAPLMQEVLQQGESDRWFFLRYRDPEPHLRVRVHGDPVVLWGKLLGRFHDKFAPLLAQGVIWKVQMDTYEPEVKRYGGAVALPIVERIFQADSEAALKILALCPGDEGAPIRWRLALKGMDEYLVCAGYGPEDRRRIAERQTKGYGREFGVPGSPMEHKLGEKFRSERRLLEKLISNPLEMDEAYAQGAGILQEQCARMAPCLQVLRDMETRKELAVPLDEILCSCLHMSINRSLRSSQRMQEMVLFDYLLRLYDSQLARLKSKR